MWAPHANVAIFNIVSLIPTFLCRPCVGCAVSKVLKDLGPNEVVILITGTGERMTNIHELTRKVETRQLPVYIISYPPTLDTTYTRLARWGGVYSVAENSHNIQPLIHLQVQGESDQLDF